MYSNLFLILFVLSLGYTVGYVYHVTLAFAVMLRDRTGSLKTWPVGVMVALCYILHHFI
jgi:hypothetical protein